MDLLRIGLHRRRDTVESLRKARDAAERRAVRLKLLSDTAAELLSTERPQDLLESLFRRVSSHLGLEIYLNFVVSEAGDHLTLASCAGVPEEALSGLRRLDFGQAICGRVAREKRPIALEDASRSEETGVELVRSLGITAYACHPLIAGGRLLGTLAFGTRLRRGFDPGELELMRTLCDQVAAAMERARLIAELRERSREAQEAREAAEAASRTKDQFLATLSHELRTPLTPLLLTARALEDDPRLPAGLRRDVERLRRNAELEARLIDDLLDLTRIARGKIELHPEVVDLHALLREVAETSINPDLPSPQLDLRLGAPVSRTWGDTARLQQVFRNLLSNAFKFTPPDGTVTITTSTGADGQLTVEVRDTGAGIDPEVLPRIFNAFEQGGSQVTRQFGGLGLGLAISCSLVTLHGGSIRADSAGRGQGATFTVTLPGAALPEAAPAPRPAALQEPARPLHILLVEDHLDTAEAMAELLRARGYRITVAPSRARALAAADAIAADGAPCLDIVVSDLGLPDGSGLDLMRELSRRHGLPGIAVSGYGTEDDLRRSREAGFADHLTKPIRLEALEAALRRVRAQAGRDPGGG